MTKITYRHLAFICLLLSIVIFFIPLIILKHPDGNTTFVSSILPTGISPAFFSYLFGLHCFYMTLTAILLFLRIKKNNQLTLTVCGIILNILIYIIFFYYYFKYSVSENNISFGQGLVVPAIEIFILGLIFYKIKVSEENT